PAITPGLCYIGHRPTKNKIKANVRQISIAVRPTLRSDLNNPNHRHQHSEIPKPAGDEVRVLSSPHEDDNSKAKQRCERASDLPGEQSIFWMRIKWRQSDRPNHLPNVSDVSSQGVAQPPGERQWIRLSASILLHEE